MSDYVYNKGDYQSGEECDPSIFKCGLEYEYGMQIEDETGTEEPVTPGNTHCQTRATNGQEYDGTLSKSEKGKTCMGWKGTKMEGRPGAGDHNYCRNPDNHKNFGGGVWCYVDRRGRGGHWEACDVDWCVEE